MPTPVQPIRILDLTRHLPGPLATLLLADLGMDIIKVEAPDGGDPLRQSGLAGEATGLLFEALNRNKSSLALDLRREEGQEVLKRLVRGADCLVEGFRPGRMAQWGLAYEDLQPLNPRLIYCSLSAYGETRPKPAHDLNLQAQTGLLDLLDLTRAEAPPPVQLADLSAGLLGFGAVVAAFLRREWTGEGRRIEVPLAAGPLFLVIPQLVQAWSGKEDPRRSLLTGTVPCYNLYQTRDDRRMALAALEPKFWETFCETVDRPDLLPRQYEATQEAREAVQSLFRSRTAKEWMALLDGVECCCELVRPVEEVVGGPLLRELGLGDESGGLRPHLPEWKEGCPAWSPAPRLGEQTESLLKEAGYEDSEIDRLAQAGVIGLGDN